jgi:hypothetical protein
LQLSGNSTTSSSVEASLVGPASVVVGNLVQGNRLATAQGRDLGLSEESKVKLESKTCQESINNLISILNLASTHYWCFTMESKFITRSYSLYITQC